jgi:hypothetical protein
LHEAAARARDLAQPPFLKLAATASATLAAAGGADAAQAAAGGAYTAEEAAELALLLGEREAARSGSPAVWNAELSAFSLHPPGLRPGLSAGQAAAQAAAALWRSSAVAPQARAQAELAAPSQPDGSAWGSRRKRGSSAIAAEQAPAAVRGAKRSRKPTAAYAASNPGAVAAGRKAAPAKAASMSTRTLLDDPLAFDAAVPEETKPSSGRSRSWTCEEDETVRQLVRQHGLRKWAMIAGVLQSKTQKQVYARWRDYLQPSLRTDPWTKEEQKRMLELHAQMGNVWAELAKLLPGRSPNGAADALAWRALRCTQLSPQRSRTGTMPPSGRWSGRIARRARWRPRKRRMPEMMARSERGRKQRGWITSRPSGPLRWWSPVQRRSSSSIGRNRISKINRPAFVGFRLIYFRLNT